MSRSYFRKGLEVLLFKEPYRFEEQTSEGNWVLSHVKTRRPLEKSFDELCSYYASQSLTVIKAKLSSIAGAVRKTADGAAGLSPKELKEYRYRVAFVRAVRGLPRSRRPLEEAISKAWSTMKAEDRPERFPGWSSVYRWMTACENSGGDTRVLKSNHAAKGNRSDRFPDEVVEVCEQELVALYLTLERPAIEHVVNMARARVRRLNGLRSPGDQLPMPSRTLMFTVLRRNHSAFDIHRARYGADAAAARFRAVLHLRETHAPLQRGEIDHTRLDMMAIDDDTGIPLGRPWLTLLIDSHTRCILGMCISFESPSSSTVAQCLRHAFTPKASLMGQIPGLRNEWEVFGIVNELVMDGGTEFYTEGLEQILLELDVEPHWAPRRTAWFKGRIERFNRTQSAATTAAVPGKTFSNIFDRADYDPKRHAVMTLSAIVEVITKWICDVYHRKLHSALGCTPLQKWKKDIQPHDLAFMTEPERVDALIGTPLSRSLDHSGVVYKRLWYNNPELVEMRRELGDEAATVDIRVNLSDLGHLVVLHPVTNAPIRVRCLQFEYADGLTDWQHSLCKKYAFDHELDDDPDAWLDSLLEIHEQVIGESERWSKKMPTGMRVGRWKQAQAKKKAKEEKHARAAGQLPVDSAPASDAGVQAVSPLPAERPRKPKGAAAKPKVATPEVAPVASSQKELPMPAVSARRTRFEVEVVGVRNGF
jgi:putative transposase